MFCSSKSGVELSRPCSAMVQSFLRCILMFGLPSISRAAGSLRFAKNSHNGPLIPDVFEAGGRVPAPGRKCSVMPWTGGGIPVDKSLPPLPKYLALKHVQKAGGSFMTDLLIKMTEGLPHYFPRYRGFFRLIEEQIAVQSVARTEEENEDLFVISSVRNP